MLVAAIVLLIFGVVAWKLLNQEKDPLDNLPGPPKLPFFGNVITLLMLRPDTVFDFVRTTRKLYGNRYVLKLANLRVLNVSSPNDVEVILSHSRNISKSLPYTFLQSWLGTGLLLSTGVKWHNRRKVLTPSFHFNILKNFANVMEEKSRDFLTRLRALDGTDVDVLPAVSDFTLYTICETAMGTQLDSDKSAATIEYKKAILEIGHTVIDRTTKFWLHNEFVFKNLPGGRMYQKYLNIVQSFADNVIISKKKKLTEGNNGNVPSVLEGEDIGSKKKLAMLDLLLEAESKGQIDLEGIREEVNTFMFEGHDTTAMAITFCIMLLANSDEAQEKVYEECVAIMGESDRSPDTNDLANMKYLEAVIKETLRLYPSVPLIGRKLTEDLMLGTKLVHAE